MAPLILSHIIVHRARMHTSTDAHKHECTQARTYTHNHKHTHKQARTYITISTHTSKHTRMQQRVRASAQACTYSHKHPPTHASTHKRTPRRQHNNYIYGPHPSSSMVLTLRHLWSSDTHMTDERVEMIGWDKQDIGCTSNPSRPARHGGDSYQSIAS